MLCLLTLSIGDCHTIQYRWRYGPKGWVINHEPNLRGSWRKMWLQHVFTHLFQWDPPTSAASMSDDFIKKYSETSPFVLPGCYSHCETAYLMNCCKTERLCVKDRVCLNCLYGATQELFNNKYLNHRVPVLPPKLFRVPLTPVASLIAGAGCGANIDSFQTLCYENNPRCPYLLSIMYSL